MNPLAAGSKLEVNLRYRDIASVTGFLDSVELKSVNKDIDAELEVRGLGLTHAAHGRTTSVHEIVGLDSLGAAQEYEPAGRIEIVDLPTSVIDIVHGAYDRTRPSLEGLLNCRLELSGLICVEYGAGEFIIPHVDYPTDDDVPGVVKVVAMSILLAKAESGGEFYVGTSGAPEFSGDSVPPDVRWGKWAQVNRYTSWIPDWNEGDAIFWGTQMLHGTRAVVSGRSRKVIAFLEAHEGGR